MAPSDPTQPHTNEEQAAIQMLHALGAPLQMRAIDGRQWRWFSPNMRFGAYSTWFKYYRFRRAPTDEAV